MNNPSNEESIEWSRGNPARRCVATNNKTGDRCRNWAIRGGAVCRYHGGATGHVKAKARERIERALDLMAMELLGIATGAESESVRLAAIRDALDRGGITAKAALELSAGRQPAPWEELIAGIAFSGVGWGITREEHRARQGLPVDEPPALPTPEIEVVDAELIPEQEPPVSASAPVTPPPRMVTYDEAGAVMRASRVQAGLEIADANRRRRVLPSRRILSRRMR